MPTNIRHHIIAATTLAAVVLYLDRICIAEIVKLDEFKIALDLTKEQTGDIMSIFFYAYAFFQVPAGWLSDRYGARRMLPLYISIWSVCTILTGLANGVLMLLAARILFGIAQAGCYPTAGSLIKRWVPLPRRGTASSIVSFGGRLGGAIAPFVTAWLLSDFLTWRWVLALYGFSGFLVAANFWRIFRETPEEHPQTNQAEQALIALDDTETSNTGAAEFPPILPLIRSGTMWLMCALQFGVNFGWVFLVTWLPTYLKDIKHVDPKTGGFMSMVVLTSGIVGLLCGGPLTDFATKKLGRRWGRSFPMVCCYIVAIAAYLSSIQLESAWAFIFAMSLVAFASDMGIPAIWAYMQDVGGKNTAAVFGWGNMWGNLGAGTATWLVPRILKQWDTNGDWHEAFWLFTFGYLVAALAALGINANRRVE